MDEQIADYRGRKITSGELKLGQRIKEAKVAEELGVSRRRAGEMFGVLERKQPLKSVPRRGAGVTDIPRSYVDSLYEILTELYTLAARRAAQHRTRQDVIRVRRALNKIRQCAQKSDVSGYYDAIFGFSTVGVAAAKSPLLAQMLSDLELSTRRAQFASLSQRAADLKKNVSFLEAAVRYMGAGDAENCAKTIRAYTQNEKEFALKVSKNQKSSATDDNPYD